MPHFRLITLSPLAQRAVASERRSGHEVLDLAAQPPQVACRVPAAIGELARERHVAAARTRRAAGEAGARCRERCLGLLRQQTQHTLTTERAVARLVRRRGHSAEARSRLLDPAPCRADWCCRPQLGARRGPSKAWRHAVGTAELLVADGVHQQYVLNAPRCERHVPAKRHARAEPLRDQRVVPCRQPALRFGARLWCAWHFEQRSITSLGCEPAQLIQVSNPAQLLVELGPALVYFHHDQAGAALREHALHADAPPRVVDVDLQEVNVLAAERLRPDAVQPHGRYARETICVGGITERRRRRERCLPLGDYLGRAKPQALPRDPTIVVEVGFALEPLPVHEPFARAPLEQLFRHLRNTPIARRDRQRPRQLLHGERSVWLHMVQPVGA
eukprot:scaffold10056_cov69-Phaeocystis_antarctica.AAC.2